MRYAQDSCDKDFVLGAARTIYITAKYWTLICKYTGDTRFQKQILFHICQPIKISDHIEVVQNMGKQAKKHKKSEQT